MSCILSILLGALAMSAGPGSLPQIPSCLYEAYGCVYYIWDHGDGTGDALVTCDRGSTFSFYSGRFGECP